MPYATIFRYARGAALFALAACGLWLAGRWVARKRPRRGDIPTALAIAYIAALAQIIALRLGLTPLRPLGGTLRPVPLATTLSAWRAGPGAFAYHVAGNALWFMPLGLLLAGRGRRWYHALPAGLALSVCLEAVQFLLGTGVSDADDVLLNALGALAGFAAGRPIARARRANRHHLTKTG